MGTTLTGTKPKDTYDSLIKVGDNGPISGTAKYLSDGLGNNLPIAVSTSNVGIGTSVPAHLLDIQSTSATLRIRNTTPPATGGISSLLFEGINNFSGVSQAFINSIQAGNSGTTQLAFGTSGSGDATATERFRITNNGVTFNGDTAQANALDDYEEGTWTATLTPFTSGTITLNVNSGTYTKIGREVTIKSQIRVGSVASPVGTAVALGGLPFTIINSNAGRGSGSATYFPTVGAGSILVNYQLHNALEWNLILTAATIAAGDEFYITLTYFV